jgi:riboflavin kinase/FMN adenylyltransferase
VREAANLLGRLYSLQGTVVHGDGRGRRIGIPTATLEVPGGKAIPANGVYACWAWLGSEKQAAAVNIGTNPTFTPEKQTANVEAYVLDFDRDLYGQEMRLEFSGRLRDEMKFPSVGALVEQIQRDVTQARGILAE